MKTISVYVGTYGKYSEGSLEGEWMNLNDYKDFDSFIEACKELHSDEKDPEFMYQDIEGIDCEKLVNEYHINPVIFDILNSDELTDDDVEAFLEYCDYYCVRLNKDDIEDEFEKFRDRYACTVWDWEDYADELFTECYNIPDGVSFYIDWGAWRRDLAFDYAFTDNYVFRNY